MSVGLASLGSETELLMFPDTRLDWSSLQWLPRIKTMTGNVSNHRTSAPGGFASATASDDKAADTNRKPKFTAGRIGLFQTRAGRPKGLLATP